MTHLTGPENHAHHRQLKRYMVTVRKEGICRVCIHREKTLGVWHCRNAPDKQHGACQQQPGSYPRFQVVENVLEEFADAA